MKAEYLRRQHDPLIFPWSIDGFIVVCSLKKKSTRVKYKLYSSHVDTKSISQISNENNIKQVDKKLSFSVAYFSMPCPLQRSAQ